MTAAVAQPRRAPSTRPARAPKATPPKLRVLDQAAIRRRARRRNAVVALFIVVLAGLFLVAMVHAQLVEGQRQLDQMRAQIGELEAERARIERSVDEATAPARIVDRAAELGMVRAENPIFLVEGGATAAEHEIGDG